MPQMRSDFIQQNYRHPHRGVVWKLWLRQTFFVDFIHMFSNIIVPVFDLECKICPHWFEAILDGPPKLGGFFPKEGKLLAA